MTRRTGIDGPDNFEMYLVDNFPGYNSATDSTNFPNTRTPEMWLVRGSVNVYKKLSGTIANRPGLKLRGVQDSTAAGTKSSWEWNTWDGRTLPLRINNSKLQVESDIVVSGSPVWYTLLSGLAVGFNRAIFDAVWDNTGQNNGQAKKDVLLFVGHDTTQYRWSGAAALFVSYAATIITLDRDAAAAGFSTQGSVLINGITYTYTGITGSTLTGTSDASAAVLNQPVFEATASSSNTPASTFTNDFLKVIGGQVYVGSYTSRLVYMSKLSSYTDFSQSTPRVTGDGYLFTLDNTCKGITVRKGNPWFGAGTSDWYEISFLQTTNGVALTEVVKVDKKPTVTLSAPLGHEFIDNIGDDIVCLTQDQQVSLIGQYTDQFQTKFSSLELKIKTELVQENFTGGHLKCISDFVYITAPVNGRHYIHETRDDVGINGGVITEKFWHPPQVSNISRFAVIAGVTYGHSNAYPQLYQVWNTGQWYDDDPGGAQLPYQSIALFQYRTFGRRQGKGSFDKLFTEGYATANSQLYAGVYYDYQGAETLLSFPLNSLQYPFAKTFTGSIPPSLGDASLGDNPLGSGLSVAADDQELVPKWKQIDELNEVDCFEYALMVYSQNASARWELLAIGANERISSFSATEIIHQV